MLVLIFRIDHIAAFLQSLHKISNGRCGSLPVIIHADQDLSLHLMEARHQRGVLSEIPGQIHSYDILLLVTKLPDHLKCVIRRAIIHQYDLIGIPLPELLHLLLDLFHHAFDHPL